MKCLPIIISIITFAFSLYIYLKHDSLIKKQQSAINEFQLNRFQKERDAEKKAVVEANIINKGNGQRIIKVYNKGKSLAKNVKVSIPDSNTFFIKDYPEFIDIKPQNSFEIKLALTKDTPDTLDISFEWEDDFSDNNKDTQTLQMI